MQLINLDQRKGRKPDPNFVSFTNNISLRIFENYSSYGNARIALDSSRNNMKLTEYDVDSHVGLSASTKQMGDGVENFKNSVSLPDLRTHIIANVASNVKCESTTNTSADIEKYFSEIMKNNHYSAYKNIIKFDPRAILLNQLKMDKMTNENYFVEFLIKDSQGINVIGILENEDHDYSDDGVDDAFDSIFGKRKCTGVVSDHKRSKNINFPVKFARALLFYFLQDDKDLHSMQKEYSAPYKEYFNDVKRHYVSWKSVLKEIRYLVGSKFNDNGLLVGAELKYIEDIGVYFRSVAKELQLKLGFSNWDELQEASMSHIKFLNDKLKRQLLGWIDFRSCGNYLSQRTKRNLLYLLLRQQFELNNFQFKQFKVYQLKILSNFVYSGISQ